MSSTAPPQEDPRPADLKVKQSLCLVLTGNGKGKTTSAIGTAVRASSMGWQVIVLQFVKSGEWNSGEQEACEKLGIRFKALGSGFTWDSNDLENDKTKAQEAWSEAEKIIGEGQHQLVVLDELTYLCSWNWIDTERVVEAVINRPKHVNVVITGRDADKRLIAIADTASEINSLHHAYDRGIAALKGIDF